MRAQDPDIWSRVVRHLLGNQRRSAGASRTRSQTRDSHRGSAPVGMRRELESYRRAQGAPYWHYADRPS